MIHDQKSLAAAYRGDRTGLIERFVPMVRRLAWHIHGGGRQGIELDDLMQAGLVALTECAQRHAGPGEDGFAAYAKLRVRGAMVDMVRRAIPGARAGAQRRRILREAENAWFAEHKSIPTSAELAEALAISEVALDVMRQEAEPLRFEPIDEAYSDSDLAYADDRPDALSVMEDRELREQLVGAITALPDRLQLVVQLYFVEELNLAEIAQAMSVSVPRVHQLKAQALERLRDMISEEVQLL